MMMEIIEIVLVPIGAALLHDYLKHATAARPADASWPSRPSARSGWHSSPPGGWALAERHAPGTRRWTSVSVTGFLWAAVAVGVVYHWLTRAGPRLDNWMPVASMAGIVYFTTVTTAAGRDNLLQVGALLFLVAVLHNTAGYFFGYWLSRASRVGQKFRALGGV